MSDTVRLVQVAHPVTATRNHLKKTIDYGTTAEIAAYTGNKGELILNTETKAINYLDGVTAGGFLPANALPVVTADTLPIANKNSEGHIYLISGSPDVAKICGKNYDGAYVWKDLGIDIDSAVPVVANSTLTFGRTVIQYWFSEPVRLINDTTGEVIPATSVSNTEIGVYKIVESGPDVNTWHSQPKIGNIIGVAATASNTIITVTLSEALPTGLTKGYVLDTFGWTVVSANNIPVGETVDAIFGVGA